LIAYHERNGEEAEPRAHPWSTAVNDSAHRYIDFKLEPQLIRTALEDWVPYRAAPFAESFFQLLEWLNGPQSRLESNDCAFRGSHANTTDHQFQYKERCDGRLMILYRNTYLNTFADAVDWLFNETLGSLSGVDEEFHSGAVGFSFLRTGYLALGDGKRRAAAGFQVGLSFFAYGNDQSSCHEAMNRLILNVRQALETINARITPRLIRRFHVRVREFRD
jgi:hypothetical protein